MLLALLFFYGHGDSPTCRLFRDNPDPISTSSLKPGLTNGNKWLSSRITAPGKPINGLDAIWRPQGIRAGVEGGWLGGRTPVIDQPALIVKGEYERGVTSMTL